MERKARQRGLLVSFALAMGLSGCVPRLIPGTSIEDTPDTRAILRVMERFRASLENRDV
jgi:hypothetical protein